MLTFFVIQKALQVTKLREGNQCPKNISSSFVSVYQYFTMSLKDICFFKLSSCIDSE